MRVQSRKLHLNQVGDTLVEVLLATVILSAVIASAYALANKATRVNVASFEKSEMSTILQSQAEMLRTVRDQGGSTWNAIWASATTSTTENTDCIAAPDVAALSARANYFHLSVPDSSTGVIVSKPGFQIPADNQFARVWIQPVRPTGVTTYTDFGIYGCWPGLGSEVNNFSGFVLRLKKEGF